MQLPPRGPKQRVLSTRLVRAMLSYGLARRQVQVQTAGLDWRQDAKNCQVSALNRSQLPHNAALSSAGNAAVTLVCPCFQRTSVGFPSFSTIR